MEKRTTKRLRVEQELQLSALLEEIPMGNRTQMRIVQETAMKKIKRISVRGPQYPSICIHGCTITYVMKERGETRGSRGERK